MELTNDEMYEISGGISWQIIGSIGAAIAYIIGVISGYTNPNRCHN